MIICYIYSNFQIQPKFPDKTNQFWKARTKLAIEKADTFSYTYRIIKLEKTLENILAQ